MRHLMCITGLTIVTSLTGAYGATYDGNGDPNASGSYNDALNWDNNDVPDSSGETATLGDVTAGNRVVTVDQATIVGSVAIDQTTAGATNTLTLNANLTIAANRNSAAQPNPFGSSTNAAAGAASVVLNVRANTLNFSGDTRSGVTLADTVDLVAGSRIQQGAFYGGGNVGYLFPGVVNVNATGGQSTLAVGPLSDANATIQSGGVLNLNAGRLSLETDVDYGQNARFTVASGGTANIAAGAELQLTPTDVFDGSYGTSVVNAGTLNLGGAIRLRPSGGTATVTNTGAFNVTSGTAAILGHRFFGSAAYMFANSSGGSIGGTGTLDFTNTVTGNADLPLTNAGTISPGNAAVGTLTLRDIDVTTANGGSVAIDVGGAAAGEYDVLGLDSGDIDLSASGDSLVLTFLNGFAPQDGQILQDVLAYGSVTGEFDSVSVVDVSGFTAQVVYDTQSADVVFIAIPEPASVGLLAIGGVLVARRRA